MDPFDLFGTEFGMRLIQLHTRHLHVLHALPMMGLGTMCSHALEAMDRLDLHSTTICSAFVADTPPLTLHQPYDRVFRELAASPQGPLRFGELSVAYRAAQPFDVLVRPGPRPMRDVAYAGTVELCTVWIGARESDISLLRWRRQGHNSPPVARNGLQDTGATPVSPRYSSPGLPLFSCRYNTRSVQQGLGGGRCAVPCRHGQKGGRRCRSGNGDHGCCLLLQRD